jgi:hypothetical protein
MPKAMAFSTRSSTNQWTPRNGVGECPMAAILSARLVAFQRVITSVGNRRFEPFISMQFRRRVGPLPVTLM